jgi:hypothetical protein
LANFMQVSTSITFNSASSRGGLGFKIFVSARLPLRNLLNSS